MNSSDQRARTSNSLKMTSKFSLQLFVTVLLATTISLVANGDYLKSLEHFELEIFGRSYHEDLSSVHKVRVVEYYSRDLKQAKIVIHGGHSGSSIEYYYNDYSSKLIKLKPIKQIGDSNNEKESLECTLVDILDLVKDLVGDSSALDVYKIFYERQNFVPNYILGYARFLYILEIYHIEFQEISNQKISIRNHEVRHFNSGDRIKGFSNLQFDGFFPIANHKIHDESGFHDAPLRFSVNIPKPNSLMIIDKYYLGQIRATSAQPSSSFVDVREMLKYPLGVGCSPILPKSHKYLVLAERKVASFHMELFDGSVVREKPNSGSLGEQFIAIDQYAHLFRRDSLDREGLYTILILDEKSDHGFVIKQPQVVSAFGNDAILTKNIEVACYGFKIKHEIQVVDPILPMKDLAEMGYAHVRGLRTIVFEQEIDRLPQLFFPRFIIANDEDKSFNYQQGKYTINYFISVIKMDDSGPDSLGPLVRVDIYKQQELKFRLEIKNFVWHLSEAPNGDKQDELFSLQDRCFTYATSSSFNYVSKAGRFASQTDRSSKLIIELEREQSSDSTAEQNEAMIRMLNEPAARNKALIRSMNQIDPLLSATRIYNLKSIVRVLNDGKLIKVMASMDVSISLPKLCKVYWLGDKPILDSSLKPDRRYMDLDECIFEASKLQRTVALAYRDFRCMIDPNTVVEIENTNESNSSGNKQQLKPINSDQLGIVMGTILQMKDSPEPKWQIFRLDFNEDDSEISSWDIIFKSSGNLKRLNIPLIGFSQDGRTQVQSLVMIPVNFELSNRKWFGNRGTDYLFNIQEALTGLTLTGRNAIVMNDLEMYSKDNGSDDLVEQNNDQVSIDSHNCFAICHANEKCKSYSICTRPSGVECLISSVQLDNETNIKRLIEMRNEKSKEAGSDKLIYLNLGLSEIDDRSVMVEFKVDRFCNTYEKRSLNMFKRGTDYRINFHLPQVQFVDELEQCARKCLEINIQAFKEKQKLESTVTEPQLAEANQPLGCSKFNHLNTKTKPTDQLIEAEFARLGKRMDLCFIDSGVSASDLTGPKLEVHFDSYEINYQLYFKQQPRIQLLGTLTKLKGANSKDFDMNEQSILNTWVPHNCARYCFMQSSGKLCRSFDFVSINNQRKSKHYCILNSKTKAQLARERPEMVVHSDQVDNGFGEAKVWHYEPQFGYLMDDQIMAQIEVHLKDNVGFSMENRGQDGSIIVLVLIISFAFMSGCLLSVVLIRKIDHMFASYRGASGFRPSVVNLINEVQTDNWQLEQVHEDEKRPDAAINI